MPRMLEEVMQLHRKTHNTSSNNLQATTGIDHVKTCPFL
jgi:hypothetical protein